ncbi:ATP-dependent DNA helicase PIF1 [Apostasia shenzhenica]|uniref:ATP-dependent DNA helicase PIF1 n=1 Tax=Apostasia shenzhenica TaxID=1088818 RepID=A0A2I0AW61_9ASPA|nr:ATP-dependent DNA helicase PIF1 [Apostasia shenzhenica]
MPPKYAQLYIYDTEHKIENRIKNWNDIHEFLQYIQGQQPDDRPDILSRVFNLKMKQICDNFISKRQFGKVTAACWRPFEFDIYKRHPPVQRLQYHLEDQQMISFIEGDKINRILELDKTKKIMLTKWFTANKKYSKARILTYTQFPMYFIWNKKKLEWTERKRGFAIGRLPYYLRMLLNIVVGAKSFNELKTINGIQYQTFKEGCVAHGLIENDNEWDLALNEASLWATASQLRNLFCMMLMFGEMSNSKMLWENHWQSLTEDYNHGMHKITIYLPITSKINQIENTALLDIERILNNNGKSLTDIPNMLLPHQNNQITDNHLIIEELHYNVSELSNSSRLLESNLNCEQKIIFDNVLNSCKKQVGETFFCLWEWWHWQNLHLEIINR